MPPTGPGRTSNAGRTAFARPRAATLARALAAFLAWVPAGASRGAAPSAAQAPADTAGLTLGERLPVVERTLPNGMRLLVLERRGAPTAAFVVQFRVGSVNETLGSTGIAHMLEHMLFKGTTTVGTRNLEAELAFFPRMDTLADSIRRLRAPPRPDTVRAARLEARLRALEDSARAWVEPNEFDRILSDHGARGLNASTDYESTSYYVELPSNRLELWFALEADRMRNPVFREFYTERDVVAEERRLRVESQPGGLLYETHMAAAFTMHPYGVPVVGYMPDIRNLTRPQVEAYYRRYYGARSAVVAIVGNVDADEVLALADRYFAELPAGEEP
ncbi:MAG: insulinase family protein, partial [Gemmatimonadetes bacterium]